jgi:hypothetical protein
VIAPAGDRELRLSWREFDHYVITREMRAPFWEK